MILGCPKKSDFKCQATFGAELNDHLGEHNLQFTVGFMVSLLAIFFKKNLIFIFSPFKKHAGANLEIINKNSKQPLAKENLHELLKTVISQSLHIIQKNIP